MALLVCMFYNIFKYILLFKGNVTARLESDPQTTVRHVNCSMFAQDE